MNDAAGVVATYYIYRVVFFFTHPMALFSSIAIGHMVNGYWGWGLFILYNLFAITYTKTAVLLALLMTIFALALASGP